MNVTDMRPLIPQQGRKLSALTIWLAAFLSPIVYCLLLMLADRFHVPAPPEVLIGALFYLIPVSALLVCISVVWLSGMTVAGKIGWTLFTIIALSVEFGILLVIITAAITAAISYP